MWTKRSTTKGAIGLFLGLRYSLPCFEKLRLNPATTSETGYLQRKITKVLEDLQTCYMGTVVTATDRVIQFSYGGDNIDANKLIKTKHGHSFVDAEHLASLLNREWETAAK